MNLLLFIDGLGSGGAQRQFSHLACGLAHRGHNVTVAVYNEQDHFAPEIRRAGVEIVRLPKPSRFSPKPIIGLGKLYRRCSADVVIAFLRSPAAAAELASLVFREMNVIAAERTAYLTSPLPPLLRLTQSFHRWARFVTVNSNNQKRAMEVEFPKLAARIITIRNGVDPPRTTLIPRGGSGDSLRLIAVSSVMPYKNSVRLAEALALLRDRYGMRVTVSWVGEKFEHLGDYGAYPETSARLRDFKLEDQWHWLGVRQDVAPILTEHDALIHPSLIEGTSNAVCEAMSVGLPVLAGSIADHEEMLRRSGAGILFNPLDVQSIAEAIVAFASLDSTARLEMGREGRAVIERDYSFDQMITAYEALAEAASSRPGGKLKSLLS